MRESEFQAELNELRARSRQQIMLNAEPVMITPPALFTDEMLEQIRAVVREELAAVNKRSADDIPPDAIVMSGEELAKKLKKWNSGEELAERLKKWKAVSQPRDTLTDASLTEENLTQRAKTILNDYDPEIEGHPSLTAELVHGSKLYKGILYYVKDVE